ncbi:hypothetical protein DVH05_004788 [Phytophthora capsici]|nr:hypothetical protein DVH05_004788 [Phytophthora capsici]
MKMHKVQNPLKPAETSTPKPSKDPWAAVMSTVVRKAPKHNTGDLGLNLGGNIPAGATSEKRISLAQMLKSREMKNLVQQALVTKQLTRTVAVPEEQSSVMSHWIKLSTLRRKQNEIEDDGGTGGHSRADTRNTDSDADSDIVEDPDGVHSAFDLDDTAKGHQLYGRTLILEESCRRALAQDCDQRSQMDLQALGVWFQTTKLKITTDFERLQPSELDLLCRRMTCVHFHPDETVFCQGDEGDALYIVFSGTMEVRVSQRILGEVVEVTVCELGKGDYFGERSLLNNDVRAATVLSKTASELVKITRNDYNLMLKNDQLEFLSRMQIANGIGVHRPVQRTQREYIKVLTKKKHARSKADIDMLSEYLQTLKFFRSLPKTFVRELCVVVDFLTLPAGACVFREGEVGDLFYIIFSGSADVNINSKDIKGNLQMTKLVNLTEGAHFGELALMKGRGVRSATVITREECQLLVICEKDYNSTLRRMQKKDMAKRVGVLDQIPMFQTPEWTGELLKELSYVLLEQKLATGSTLYNQGDRATHVYFVVRGELVVTKEIADPFTHVKHEVFVERIGRFRVVGDDAAAGVNFNDVIHREVTVHASTPVEVLQLSKYDVFHRLSRSARETLRAAAQSHAESIVYLDRFHKTQKWETYKKKVLRDHVNHERIEKILPSAAKPAKKSLSRPAAVPQGGLLPALPLPTDKKAVTCRPNRSSSERQALVPANELLLLTQEAKAMKKCFDPHQTLGNYVTSFNVDAPPSSTRQVELDGVLKAEKRREAEVLKEGNPLAFFDIKVVDKQPDASWRAKTLVEDQQEKEKSPILPDKTRNDTSLTITPQALSQLLQENFIFSRPHEAKPQGHDARKGRTFQPKFSIQNAVQKLSSSPQRGHSPSRMEGIAETDYVLFIFRSEMDEARPETTKSSSFQLVQSVRSLFAAREVVEKLKERDCGPVKYYILPLKAFALLPRSDRPKQDEERLQWQQVSEMTSSGRAKSLISPSSNASTSSLQSTGDNSVQFASFQEVIVPTIPNEGLHLPGSIDAGSVYTNTIPTQSSSTSPRRKPVASIARSAFAVASVVLSKLEVAHSQYPEPFVAIHGLFVSEMEAVTYAMNLKPSQSLKSAMLCVFPVGKWIHLENSHDWCVQVEANKREKRASLTGAAPTSPTTSNPTGKSRRLSLVAEPPKPKWQQDQKEAKRLHNFICARMGAPAMDKKKDWIEDSGGFTPQPLVSYLQANTPSNKYTSKYYYVVLCSRVFFERKKIVLFCQVR